MLGCCFLVAEYASEYHKRKRAAEQDKPKRSYEMRVRALVCGDKCACACVSVPDEGEALLPARDV